MHVASGETYRKVSQSANLFKVDPGDGNYWAQRGESSDLQRKAIRESNLQVGRWPMSGRKQRKVKPNWSRSEVYNVEYRSRWKVR